MDFASSILYKLIALTSLIQSILAMLPKIKCLLSGNAYFCITGVTYHKICELYKTVKELYNDSGH
jgi:hypothetical protein